MLTLGAGVVNAVGGRVERAGTVGEEVVGGVIAEVAGEGLEEGRAVVMGVAVAVGWVVVGRDLVVAVGVERGWVRVEDLKAREETRCHMSFIDGLRSGISS